MIFLFPRFILIFFLFIFISASNAAKENPARQQMIDHGKSALYKKDVLAAIDDFSRALILDPDDGEVQKLLIGLTIQEVVPSEVTL